jgi:hypothetical protein
VAAEKTTTHPFEWSKANAKPSTRGTRAKTAEQNDNVCWHQWFYLIRFEYLSSKTWADAGIFATAQLAPRHGGRQSYLVLVQPLVPESLEPLLILR